MPGSKAVVKKLRNVSRPIDGDWRIRVADYRMRYYIDADKVVVTRVAHRSEVHSGL